MVDYDKIVKLYGDEILYQIKDNLDDVNQNLNYLNSLNILNADDIFERYVLMFICDPKSFENKMNKLIDRLGVNYVTLLEEDSSYFGDIL